MHSTLVNYQASCLLRRPVAMGKKAHLFVLVAFKGEPVAKKSKKGHHWATEPCIPCNWHALQLCPSSRNLRPRKAVYAKKKKKKKKKTKKKNIIKHTTKEPSTRASSKRKDPNLTPRSNITQEAQFNYTNLKIGPKVAVGNCPEKPLHGRGTRIGTYGTRATGTKD